MSRAAANLAESPALSLTISPEEWEFFAEETLITITTSSDLGTLKFISGHFGPVFAGEPCEVPLWLAIALRKKGKCIIAMPDWLNPANLEVTLKEETDNDNLSALPFHYIEIVKLLLTNAKEDFESPDKVAVLVKDIENVRMAKLRAGCELVAASQESGNELNVTVRGISSIELATVKGFLVAALGARRQLMADPPAVNNNRSNSNVFGRLGEIDDNLARGNYGNDGADFGESNNNGSRAGGRGLTRRFRDG